MKLKLYGIEYHVKMYGNGYPLVLLHGFTGAASNWEPFSAILGNTSRLIMVDLIGHGRTDIPKEQDRYRITKVAADLNGLLHELKIAKADILGYSMGGRLAITFAALYPNKVRKLVLESTTPGLKTEKEKETRRKQDANLAARILAEGLEGFIDYWEKIPLFQTQMNLSAVAREQIRKQRLKNNPIGLANSLLGMGTGAQPSWWDTLATFDFETLILTGEKDLKFCRIAEEMEKLIHKTEYYSIINAGHAIHVEEPEKFGTIVNGFLSKTNEP